MKNEQSGRSLIEMLGVLAIAGIMTAGAIVLYNSVRTRQARIVAQEQLKETAENARTLFAAKRDYTGISTQYLIDAGAIKNDKSPLPNVEFSVVVNPTDASGFVMLLDGVGFDDCAWLATIKLDWARNVSVNGFSESAATYCKKLETNQIEIWVE
ncbi:MAG: type II secretion system GspH family protein [Rickettsiales bacterium]|jgi:Tfp pilus assembly protein PilE|nr:type II secretion system GspH family protein [Rickettsiales bacterium]